MAKSYSIVLVDDHVVVRNGLKELIELMGTYRVTAQYDNGKELTDALPLKQAPDLIIMDMNMPVMNGMQTMQWIKDKGLKYPVLVLTLNTEEELIIQMYKLGIRGYLEKDCTAPGLQQAIGNIIRTGYHHNDLLTKALQADEKPQPVDERVLILSKMTTREQDFLHLVCDEAEYTYEQMADKLHVSRRTIDGYRESLFDKFDIKSKTGLVLFAIRYRLINKV